MPPPLVVYTMAQGNLDDPRYSYHDDGCHNKNPEERRELIEVKEKYLTLEKRVKAMEGGDIFGPTAMICAWFQI